MQSKFDDARGAIPVSKQAKQAEAQDLSEPRVDLIPSRDSIHSSLVAGD